MPYKMNLISLSWNLLSSFEEFVRYYQYPARLYNDIADFFEDQLSIPEEEIDKDAGQFYFMDFVTELEKIILQTFNDVESFRGFRFLLLQRASNLRKGVDRYTIYRFYTELLEDFANRY